MNLPEFDNLVQQRKQKWDRNIGYTVLASMMVLGGLVAGLAGREIYRNWDRKDKDSKLLTYVKEGISIQAAYEDGRRESLGFSSGCTRVYVDHFSTGDRITLRKNNPLIPNCETLPEVASVEALLETIEKFSDPTLECTIFDAQRKPVHLSYLDGQLARPCYEQKTASKVQKCLLKYAPANWTVECK